MWAPVKSKTPEEHYSLKGYGKETVNRALAAGAGALAGGLPIGLAARVITSKMKNPGLRVAYTTLGATIAGAAAGLGIAEYKATKKGNEASNSKPYTKTTHALRAAGTLAAGTPGALLTKHYLKHRPKTFKPFLLSSAATLAPALAADYYIRKHAAYFNSQNIAALKGSRIFKGFEKIPHTTKDPNLIRSRSRAASAGKFTNLYSTRKLTGNAPLGVEALNLTAIFKK